MIHQTLAMVAAKPKATELQTATEVYGISSTQQSSQATHQLYAKPKSFPHEHRARGYPHKLFTENKLKGIIFRIEGFATTQMYTPTLQLLDTPTYSTGFPVFLSVSSNSSLSLSEVTHNFCCSRSAFTSVTNQQQKTNINIKVDGKEKHVFHIFASTNQNTSLIMTVCKKARTEENVKIKKQRNNNVKINRQKKVKVKIKIEIKQ